MVSPGRESLETGNLIKEAHDSARKYRWIDAAGLCRLALSQTESITDRTILTSLTEFSAKCHFKGAFQAGNRNDFVELVTLARQAYEKACTLHTDANQFARSRRALSRVKIAEFWLQRNPSDRMILARSIVDLSKEAAGAFEDAREEGEKLETILGLLAFFREFINLATDFDALKGLFDEAVQTARNTIDGLEKQQETEGLVEALNKMIWLLAMEAQVVLPPSEFQSLAEEIRKYQDRLEAAALELGTPYGQCLVREGAGHIAFDVAGDPKRALEEYEASVVTASGLDDALLLGRLRWVLSQVVWWLGYSEGDAEKRRLLFQKGVDLASAAIENLQIPLQTTELTAAHATCAACYIELADQTDIVLKREHLRKAIEIASQGTRYESETWAWSIAASDKAKALYLLSRIEEPQSRLSLLREALQIREQTVHVTDRLFPNFWNTTIMRHQLALVRSELATLEGDLAIRQQLLSQAITDMESCLGLGAKWATTPDFIYRLAKYGESYGEILLQSYTLTKESILARKAIKAYKTAIEQFTSSKHTAEAASLRWKTARVHDGLGEFKDASEAFRQAAESYKLVAEEVPALKTTFEELAHYMGAWGSIERARVHHGDEEYSLAYASYADAAKMLRTTKTWGYLSTLCTARSLLEKGENLSSEEKHAAATQLFSQALESFKETTKEIEDRLATNTDPQVLQELENWLRASRQRETYCRGRMDLEAARELDKKGEKTASARKYLSAFELFKALSGEMESVQDRGELETLTQFCDAWGKMKQAESKASAELYADAAESFLKVRETASRQQFRLLAEANASICRALDFGTRFRLTRDSHLYSEVKKQLETAADYYREAGYNKTESYTRATQKLFDALVYLSDAEAERDPKKKTELYLLAEKHSELAAKLYGEAGFPNKKKEALQHLGRAREEKELLLTSLEALSEIPVASGSSVTSISPGRGQPPGLERFEEANVVGHLTVPERELKAGSDFAFEIEMANAGRATATLVRLENVVPEGFEIEREKNPYRIEGHSIDLRGRRLEHLKMDEMKIVLRPVQKGTFQLRPRAVFADDRGNYRQLEFESVEVRVGELGFSGWLRGPGKRVQPREKSLEIVATSQASLTSRFEGVPPIVRVPPEFKFETERAREVFRALVKAFVSDYVVKRLFVEKAGWRSLMDLVREMKIPRSAVYAPGGRDGPVLEELEQRGLVEARIFPKERGRGGDIKKVRVAYDNEIVKRIVEQTVIEDK